jgi:hypothetical protein
VEYVLSFVPSFFVWLYIFNDGPQRAIQVVNTWPQLVLAFFFAPLGWAWYIRWRPLLPNESRIGGQVYQFFYQLAIGNAFWLLWIAISREQARQLLLAALAVLGDLSSLTAIFALGWAAVPIYALLLAPLTLIGLPLWIARLFKTDEVELPFRIKD